MVHLSTADRLKMVWFLHPRHGHHWGVLEAFDIDGIWMKEDNIQYIRSNSESIEKNKRVRCSIAVANGYVENINVNLVRFNIG